jgi:chromosomal replication initiation ATPase DnaA
MRERVTQTEFETWFPKLEIVESPEFQIVSPNQFHKTWLEQHYKADLLEVAGRDSIVFGVKGASA